MKTLVLCSTLLITTGCAFTVHDVNVDYAYDQPININLDGKELVVGEISDSRSIENPRMIVHMKNGYGQTTSGGWQAEKPLNEIVRGGIIQGLSSANANLNGGGNMELSGEFLAFDSETIMGLWEGSYKGKITVKFQLLDKSSNNIKWRDTFIGSAEVKGKEGVTGLLTATIDDLVTQLITDDYFKQKFLE